MHNNENHKHRAMTNIRKQTQGSMKKYLKSRRVISQ
jgi:hypothetical protein